ncbi:MAG: carboxypeptidase-like regulatory domain-containing protein [Planctomycetia bacterium]|nr:carboxypeptidase-like regulatory domain-containing protein [Planctomycetia bacterium]
MNKHIKIALFFLGFIVIAGCGEGGPKTYNVSGTVFYKDQPVDGAMVVFSPSDGGLNAVGTTDAAGKFVLRAAQGSKSWQGTVPGNYEIGITKRINTAPVPAKEEMEAARAAGEDLARKYPVVYKDLIPVKYNNPSESGLTATVEAGKENTFEFNLTD